MEVYREKAKEIVAQLTIEEKAALCTGIDFWHIQGSESFNLKAINITDGPHGLRKQEDDRESDNYGKMVPAVCYPPAVTSSCSFDPDLLEKMGQAIGAEARAENVAVVLGPGVNIKRSPLCGRNFEYFSEDPLLAGKLAAGLIRGIESRNVGTSMKHFAANNQESWRMVSDSVIDERALREIYLRPFEIAVREAEPATLMCSYNRINGTYASDNDWLLNQVLRGEWGFAGAVMSDWGATNDRVKATKAGLDLSMPGPVPNFTEAIIAAVAKGTLAEATLDTAAERIVTLVLRGNTNERLECDKEAQHILSGEIAAECAVLLENDGSLPLKEGVKLAVLGSFAVKPKFQGGGSSDIPYSKRTSFIDALEDKQIPYSYSEGYAPKEIKADPVKLEAARQTALEADQVIVFAGLPRSFESESFDRADLNLPESHLALIDVALETGKPVHVVLMQGSATLLPFRDKVNSLLLAGLTGQNGGTAIRDLLFGAKNPSGRLSESYPLSLSDVAAMQNFGGRTVPYAESIYVGYRWFDTAAIPVQYPFGYGLSYTKFAYSNLRLSSDALTVGDSFRVSLDVTNTGDLDGKEVVQIYLSAPEKARAFFPAHELKGFSKLFLRAGETKEVVIEIPAWAFEYFDNKKQEWLLASGEYTVHAAKSSRDFVLSARLSVSGNDQAASDYRELAPEYYQPHAGTKFSESSFAALYGSPLPEEPATLPYTRHSTISDLRQTRMGRFVLKQIMRQMQKSSQATDAAPIDLEDSGDFIIKMIYGFPLRGLMPFGGDKLGERQIQGLVDILNGRIFRGLKNLKSKERLL